MKTLTFAQLAEANLARATEKEMPFSTFTPLYFATELAGETGELCNVIKKLERLQLLGHRHPMNYNADSNQLLEARRLEIGDCAIVLDLLAQSVGLSLADCVTLAFNQKSANIRAETRLCQN